MIFGTTIESVSNCSYGYEHTVFIKDASIHNNRQMKCL